MSIHLFLLDNVDSFTYNLVDEMASMGIRLTIYRNHVPAQAIFQQMQQASEDARVMLMLSPGPGAPSQAGCMPELLNLVQGQFPVLGICLGHQAIIEHYGGTVGRAKAVVHGKGSSLNHCAEMMFKDLPVPLSVARYHSLVATQLPATLQVIADISEGDDSLPMAVYHPTDNMLGFQFHPESILTSRGSQLLQQSIEFLTKD